MYCYYSEWPPLRLLRTDCVFDGVPFQLRVVASGNAAAVYSWNPAAAAAVVVVVDDVVVAVANVSACSRPTAAALHVFARQTSCPELVHTACHSPLASCCMLRVVPASDVASLSSRRQLSYPK